MEVFMNRLLRDLIIIVGVFALILVLNTLTACAKAHTVRYVNVGQDTYVTVLTNVPTFPEQVPPPVAAPVGECPHCHKKHRGHCKNR